MSSLKELLSRVRPGDDFEDISNRVKEIILSYNRPGIHRGFRNDVVTMIGNVLDLAESMAEKAYRLDEVFNDIAEIQQSMSQLLRHGLMARPRATGFALLNTASGSVLPGFYASEAEAVAQLKFVNTLGITIPIVVVPAECVTLNILQPEEPGTATLISPPVTAQTPAVAALKPNPQPASPFHDFTPKPIVPPVNTVNPAPTTPEIKP